MDTGACDHVFREEGFAPIGSLGHDLVIKVWWHSGQRIQITMIETVGGVLLKGTKCYAMVSASDEGETWARDVNALHEYLEAHFPELHLSFMHYRDLSAWLARRAASQTTRARGLRSYVDRRDLARQLQAERTRLASAQRLLGLSGTSSPLLAGHLRANIERSAARVAEVQDRLAQRNENARLYESLQDEYLRKGSAACLVFTLNSNGQTATDEHGLRSAVLAITRELQEAHRHEVTQRLGGKLNIRVREVSEPVLAWLEQWAGGPIHPRQLEALPGSADVLEPLTEHVMVTADEDIHAGDVVAEQKKLLAPRVVASLISRLDRPGARRGGDELPALAMPLTIGLNVDDAGRTTDACAVPLVGMTNAYVSGKSGSGKSVLMRVLAEEVSEHKGVAVLVLDPRNQSAGLLAPEDRPHFLSRYEEFGNGQPRAFDFRYCAPGVQALPALPARLRDLARDKHIVSFRGLSDADRCDLFAQVLDEVFTAVNGSEADTVRLVILIEEAQLFTRKRVAPEAADEADRAEVALDRVLREGRKYGLCTIVSSQSILDFSHKSSGVRQNCGTKFFLHNSDRELDYARDYVVDARELVRLPVGTALACGPAFGLLRVKVRPPLSKVWEFGERETLGLVRGDGARPCPLSDDARRLLTQLASPENAGEVHMSFAARLMGITSKRRLQGVVDELERAGRIRTHRLRGERGSPRVIRLTDAGHNGVGTRTQPDTDTSGEEVRS